MDSAKRFRYLTATERENVVKSYKKGIPMKTIAMAMNIHRTTVYRIINNLSSPRNSVGGAKRTISKQSDNFIRTTLKRNCLTSIKELQRTEISNFSYWLIRRLMLESGLKLIGTRVKPALKSDQRKERMAFIKKYI